MQQLSPHPRLLMTAGTHLLPPYQTALGQLTQRQAAPLRLVPESTCERLPSSVADLWDLPLHSA